MELVEAKMSDTQKALAQEVFRLHILANSDSEEDQNVKLAVRDAVIAYMENAEACSTELERAETTGTGALSTELDSAESAKAWACAHLDELEQVADRILAEQGYDYQAKAEVVTCYFPEKEYGDITFPAGNYQALRIKLGKAEGHNWWCVLYPGLCFTSQTCAVVTEEGKESLQKALTEEEYEMVTAATEFKIRWFFFGDAKDK
jgi:stage II sporulation protein R